MKTTNILWMLLTVAALTSACSNDDDTPSDPQGTVTLNMLDEANGKTVLDNSGIYIDKAQNFVAGNDCQLFVVGKTGGLGSVSAKSLSTPVSQAAAVSGYGYIAARPRALIIFPSGAQAMPIGNSEVNFLKLYVVSPIEDGGKKIGAAVKYVLAMPETYGLPEFGSTALEMGWDEFYSGKGASLILSDPDFEYDLNDINDDFTCEKSGRKLTLKLNHRVSESYTLYLRIRESYTKVTVKVTMAD